jgi:hypothetical protein
LLRLLRKASLLWLGLGCMAVAATITVAASRDKGSPQTAEFASNPDPFTRANGLDPAAARPAGNSHVIGSLRVIRGKGVTCIIFGDGDHCLPEKLVAEGRDVSIQSSCGGRNKMMAVFGAVPPKTYAVGMRWSNGIASYSKTINGVFVFDSATPSKSSHYPIILEWRERDSHVLFKTPFPLEPNQFCLNAR